MDRFDFVLVGGGLQNSLIALALNRRRPGLRVALVERADRLGGNHTWCFHAGDFTSDTEALIEPLVVRRWPGYEVQFPQLYRYLDEPYAAVTSQRLHEVVSGLEGVTLLLGAQVDRIESGRVEIAGAATLEAGMVVDARGPESFVERELSGYQKFLGLELEVDPASAPRVPTLMDARIEQRDGFRFFYALPLAPDRLLLEDTYFSDSAVLDRELLRREVRARAAALGISERGVVREEAGVLPLPARLGACAPPNGVIRGGYQGGWFHPTTGYSFPLALRLADELSRGEPSTLAARVARLSRERVTQQRFCTLLNRLLFAGFAPEDRFRVLERFYRLPPPTIRRFYAMNMTLADRLRILCGRPPSGLRVSRLLSPNVRSAHGSPQGEPS